jgi:hypothetical protein
MRRETIQLRWVAAWFALIALAGSAQAAVFIKTNRVTICVTDTKHPDACKKTSADGSAVVSEDALESLQGELGQGASIMEATAATRPQGGQGRHHRHSEDDQAAPAQ